MAGYNEYDTFTYEKAPDFTKSFDEAANMNAWGLASEQEAANARTRLEDAKATEAAVNQASKLSITLAKTYKEWGEKRDERWMGEAYQVHMEAGITQAKLRSYNERNKDKAGYQKDVGLYQEAAVKARANNNHTLADKLEDMTGRRLLMAKQSLLRQAAINWRAGFDRGKDSIQIQRDDGTTLTYGNIRDVNEYNQIVREYNVSMGFADVSWASHEFIDEEFRGTMEREQSAGLLAWQSKRNAARKDERVQNWRTALAEGAETNQLGKTIYDLMTMDWAYSSKGTKTSMREDLRDMIAVEIDRFKATNGEQGIDPASLDSLDNFTFWHDGDKENVPLSKFKEFDNSRGGGLAQAVINAQVDRLNARDNEHKVIQSDYMATWQDSVEKHGLPSNHDVAQAIIQFKTNNPNVEVPPGLITAYTIEDQDDDDKVEAMYAKANRGEKLTSSDWAHIVDKTKRDDAKEFAQGPGGTGIDSSVASNRDTALVSAVGVKLSELGLGTKSSEYNIMLENSKAEFNSLYMKYKGTQAFGGDDQKLYNWVIQEIEGKIEKGQIQGVRPDAGDPRNFTNAVVTGQRWILSPNNKTNSITNLLASDLIPGSEKYLARLEGYALDPVNRQIPTYYDELAKDIPTMSGWDVANLQYKSQTGKDLPKPKTISDLEKRSPLIQYMYKHRPSGQKIDRADKIESGHDFNSQESLIPGLVFNTEATVG